MRLAIETVRLPTSVEFKVDVPEADALLVECDPRALAFAVRCLLENAGEALGAGLVRVHAEATHHQCRITVTDHGPGISDAARCLERFQTTKPGHLGLGLCMARRIASRCRGDLLVGSPERGAQVSLLLPRAGAQQEPPEIS